MAEIGAYCFEQPVNERIRTFLRLEHLIARLRHHETDDGVWGRRATLDSLLDLLNVMSRHDIRGEISKELVQRHDSLKRLADRDDVDSHTLSRILDQLDALSRQMHALPPQFAAYQLRDNELLNSLNNRAAMPGGSCGFDLPGYYHWLAQPSTTVKSDIQRWSERIAPFENAVGLLLRLLRDSTETRLQTADAGVLVHNTETGTQLIRVLLDEPDMYPEISAGRHRATVRFMQRHDDHMHARQVRHAVQFRMACCRF